MNPLIFKENGIVILKGIINSPPLGGGKYHSLYLYIDIVLIFLKHLKHLDNMKIYTVIMFKESKTFKHF